MADESLFKNDLELHRKMREPFESVDAANKALAAFHEELGELRKKHKMTNLLAIIGSSYVVPPEGDEPADEAQFLYPMFFGNLGEAEPMAAYLLAYHQAERAKVLERAALSGKKKRT